jgi:beta-lactamase regulating signal transducer with metallopeptidase domain/Tfp pilus assembly protein PilF
MTSHAITMALLHFVWQGTAVAAVLWIVITIFRGANARYLACCAAMAVMVALPVITAWSYRAPRAAGVVEAFVPPATTSAASVSEAASEPATNWAALAESWVLPLWAIGVAVFAVRMAWGCGQVAKLRRGGASADAGILETANRVAQRMGLDRATQVLVSDGTGGPSVVGWLRPVILLPACAISGLSAEQLEAVLAHELAHIRRYDALVNLAQMAIETVLFYHPAVWWVSHRIRQERELCCDDLAVRMCADALCYARALTVLERMRLEAPAAALGATDGSLRHRIERIVGVSRQEYGAPRGAEVVAAALVIAGLAFGLHSARAQQSSGIDYLQQGDLLLKDGRNDDAMRMYVAGEKQEPQKRTTYLKRMIEVLVREGKRAEARDVNNSLLKDNPDDTDALELLATFMIEDGKVEEAIGELEELGKRVPNNPVLHYNLGRAYPATKQYDRAANEYLTALGLRPDYTLALLGYANLLIEQHQYGGTARTVEEARKLLDPLRASNPSSPEIWAELAALDQRLGNFEVASDEYLKMYELQSGNERGLRLAAVALIEGKQPGRAIELVRGETLKYPDRMDLMMDLGDIAGRAGQFRLAEEAYGKMIESPNPRAQAAGRFALLELRRVMAADKK